MGWKKIKDHYRIGHIVQMTKEGVCIGSPYVSVIILIGLDGVIKKRYEDRGNEDLSRYQSEFDADPALLKRLLQEPDTFSASITVYTYNGGDIVEKHCEALNWPNVTHDGCLMYENTFSADKSRVIKWAKSSAASGAKAARGHVLDAEKNLAEKRKWLEDDEAALAKLSADYPDEEVPSTATA
jgi:hypothetical protein